MYLKCVIKIKTQTMNKVGSMVSMLDKLTQGKTNVDDIKQVFNDITNTMANLLTVNIFFIYSKF
jgi:hypothetical protein